MIEEFEKIKCSEGGFCEIITSRLRYREKGVLLYEKILYKCKKCGKIHQTIIND